MTRAAIILSALWLACACNGGPLVLDELNCINSKCRSIVVHCAPGTALYQIDFSNETEFRCDKGDGGLR
jgi:hypothetical protein